MNKKDILLIVAGVIYSVLLVFLFLSLSFTEIIVIFTALVISFICYLIIRVIDSTCWWNKK